MYFDKSACSNVQWLTGQQQIDINRRTKMYRW
jgi:hypothetical protein